MSPDFIRPKDAALEAGTHSQQIYDAIRKGRLHVRRCVGRVLIERVSFERWKTALETRRRLLLEQREDTTETAQVRA
jgi:Helix-turn-helix domain